MSPVRHCDEIIRLIDEVLNQAPTVSSDRGRRPDQRVTSSRCVGPAAVTR